MKSIKPRLLLIILIITSFSCSNFNNARYQKEIHDWRTARLERLKSKTGWLNLAGLYWLREGQNTFGSDSSNTIIFPANAGRFYGSIEKKEDSIFLMAGPEADIKVGNITVSEMSLKNDSNGKPTLMESGSLAWFIIKREDRYGIRLRDYNNPRISNLDSIPAYRPSEKWRVNADFIPFDTIRKIETATVIGGTEISNCPGKLVFRKGFKKYTLYPFSEGDQFFIIFADKTNGIETYGNGRFIYTSIPDSSNKVIIDFNKAYNPPCAFSPFATCPMPPRENILDLKIKAGEKEVHLF
jgi:uncharacterized protein